MSDTSKGRDESLAGGSESSQRSALGRRRLLKAAAIGAPVVLTLKSGPSWATKDHGLLASVSACLDRTKFKNLPQVNKTDSSGKVVKDKYGNPIKIDNPCQGEYLKNAYYRDSSNQACIKEWDKSVEQLVSQPGEHYASGCYVSILASAGHK